MSRKPKIAIVGRPNVGKSALFNRICKKRIAIVDEAEGITRDRLYSDAECFGRPFQVIDTGGIDPHSKAVFNAQIKQQAEIAIEEADSLILVVDGRLGLTQLDEEVAAILHTTKKPVCLAVNKIDDPSQEYLLHPFYCLGIKQVIAVSATQGYQIAELLEAALKKLPVNVEDAEGDAKTKISIVGRANVGKSTLVNTFLKEDRCIVSPIAGTTRDSIDIDFIYKDKTFTLIDTAGIRRKKSEKEVVEKFAAMRTETAITRADICLLMLDASQGMTVQEKRIANQIEEAGKGCVLIFNKWDLVKGFRMEHCIKGIKEENRFLAHCPMLFISAEQGRNLDKIFPMVEKVYENSQKRITTHQLNKFLERAMQLNHPPMITGRRLRIYYMAQVDIHPPKFILFVNHTELLTDTYKKYLINKFREHFDFAGIPLVVHLKGKAKKERPEKVTAEDETLPQHSDMNEEVIGDVFEEDGEIVEDMDDEFDPMEDWDQMDIFEDSEAEAPFNED